MEDITHIINMWSHCRISS